jgi:hypothetical protein
MRRRDQLTAARFIEIHRRVRTDEARQRLAERDARQAADNRTEAQKFLGDPPPGRSALAQAGGSICAVK